MISPDSPSVQVSICGVDEPMRAMEDRRRPMERREADGSKQLTWSREGVLPSTCTTPARLLGRC